MTQKTFSTNSVGQLIASNLFPVTVKNSLAVNNSTVSRNRYGTTRLERVVFNELVEEHKPIIAALPYIDSQARAMTMDNYRKYVSDYNKKLTAQNLEIKDYNTSVRLYKRENKEKLTEVQKQFSNLFIIKNFKKTAIEFNPLAEEFNKEYGLLIEKKKFVTIKYATELIFQQILFLYSMELAKYTNEYIKVSIQIPKPLRQISINSWKIANFKRNDILAIDVCNATIRNHRSRLEESGILLDYLFRGHKAAVKMNINSQILVVFDAATGKYSNAENQLLTSETHKELANKDEATRTYINNIKKRENDKIDFLDLGTASPGLSICFLQEHPVQCEKVKTGGGKKNVKLSSKSEKLDNLILHPQQLAEDLAAGNFNNYKRIDKRVLYDEAVNGTIDRERFKELIIQEFFCNAAKLYRIKTVFIGSWKKAINSYLENLFFVNNGNEISLYKKELMVDKLQEMLWRLNNAQKWFSKAKINPLFPSFYFDFNRTDKKEIGFEYTKIAYKNHLKYIENKPKLAKAEKKKAELRKKTINYSKIYDQKINLFFKNRIELDDLIEYVSGNLPAQFLEKLNETIIKFSHQNILNNNSKFYC